MVVQQLPGKETPEAPYATPGHVLGILSRYRERSLPPVLGVETVEDALGTSKVYAYRALAALRFLGFLDADRHPEPVSHRLRELSDDEFKVALSDQIRQAYPRLFQGLDPAKDDEQNIRDHFRRYDPHSQTQRQFQFFRAMCVAADLMEGKAAIPPKGQRSKQARLVGTGPTNNRRQVQEPSPPSPPPASDEDVRRLLAEALIDKIREVEAGDWDTIQRYRDQIERLTDSAKKDA